MKFTIETTDSFKKEAACFVIAVFEEELRTDFFAKLDKTHKGKLSQLIEKSGDFKGKADQTTLLYLTPTTRVLLLGCGKKRALSVREFRKILALSVKTLLSLNIDQVLLAFAELPVENHNLAWKIKFAVETYRDALYRFDEFKSQKSPPYRLASGIFLVPQKELLLAEEGLQQGIAVANGITLTKNLANLPSNVCTPTYLANAATKLAKKHRKVGTQSLNKNQIKKLGMGAFYAVAKGSAEDAKLITVTYQGAAKKEKPVVLIGKGITFDTGGISLKQPDGMIGMKYDMCGAATILGVIEAIAELKLPVNVVGLLACAENMPSGIATKPEDIVKTMSGQTVEILNTDAEGRLVLCDTLTYAEQFSPRAVIDIATLTYAVVVALGYHATGLLSNNDELADQLYQAGMQSYDRAWRMPIFDEYQDQLKSSFADMTNSGGRTGGTITAACFLSRFAKKFKWAHLDVAGTATVMAGSDRYATGRPIPLLVQYLINLCK